MAKQRLCVECEDVPALVHCEACGDDFCGIELRFPLFHHNAALCFKFQHFRGKRTAHKATFIPGADPKIHLLGDNSTDMFSGLTALEEKTAQVKLPNLLQPQQIQQSQKSSPNRTKKRPVFLAEPLAFVPEKKSKQEFTATEGKSVSCQSQQQQIEQKSIDFAKWIPLRLTPHEREMLAILEGVLTTSEYTDKVDVAGDAFGWRMDEDKKIVLIKQELHEVFSLISGLTMANDLKNGKNIIKNSFKENQALFQNIFEVGRRYKILNPDKMRTTYGKLMHLLQDAIRPGLLDFDVIKPIETVFSFLKEKGGLALLSDPLLKAATADAQREAIQQQPQQQGAFLTVPTIGDTVSQEEKHRAQRELALKYANEKCTEDDVLLAIHSISDANVFLAQNRDPVQRMQSLLEKYFNPNLGTASAPSEDESASEHSKIYYSLEIESGVGGSFLTHSHKTQFTFVLQSLSLWKEIQESMFKLWLLTDKDLLDPHSPYRLFNTGQGMARMQSSPRISAAMHAILRRVQRSLGEAWVGLSVVHLGDRDVPNGLFFIDKYTQVPRILCPILQVMDAIPRLEADSFSNKLFAIVRDKKHGARLMQRYILRDFFRHGFDGSGSDGGSCVDGRLTSAWNWCSKCSTKVYYPIMLAAGFRGFDGDFK